MTTTPRRASRVAVPDTRNIKDPAVANVLKAMSQTLQILAGERGSGYDRAVTLRELTEEGNVFQTRNGKLVARDHVKDPDLPGNGSDLVELPAVAELSAFGLFEQVMLTWSFPTNLMQYISYFEVWRAPINDRAAATLVGKGDFVMFTDTVGEGVEVYYWVRGVSADNIATAWNAAEGTKAVTELPPEKLIEKVRGEIDDSVLATDLKNKIDTSALEAAEALQEVTTVGNTLGGVQQTLQYVQNRANQTYAQWSVKAQIRDMVYGVGLLANGSGADFGVSATRFFMYDPTASNPYKQYPFMVSGGRVYINSAVIKDASITTAKVRNFGAEVINGIKANIQDLSADFMTLNNGVITGEIKSANYSYGSRGWKLTQTGSLYAFGNDVEFGGKLRAASGTFTGDLAAAGGTFSGKLTANAIDAIDTINLKGYAVRVAKAVNFSTGERNIILDMNNARPGTRVIIHIHADTNFVPRSSWIDLYVKRNGARIITPRIVNKETDESDYIRYQYAGTYIDNPGSGTHMYTIVGKECASITCVIDGAKA